MLSAAPFTMLRETATLVLHEWDFFLLCVLGLVVSAYSLMIEIKMAANPKYRAMCDIHDSMSCSRVLMSEYSRGFGLVRYVLGEDHPLNIPNPVTGLFFYSLLVLLGVSGVPWATSAIFSLVILSCVGSAYLAAILAFKIKTLCLVCLATYVINALLLYVTW